MTVYKAKLMDVCEDRTGNKIADIILGRFIFAKEVEEAIERKLIEWQEEATTRWNSPEEREIAYKIYSQIKDLEEEILK